MNVRMASLSVGSLFVSLAFLFTTASADAKKTSAELIRQYGQLWNGFVEAFQAEVDADKRRALIKVHSEKANALLADHLKSPEIKRVLPRLQDTKLLDLDPTFLAVFSEHPDEATRAQALLSFGHYLGKNGRFKDCDITFAHLKKAFGKVEYRRRQTFGSVADHYRYFYENLAVGREAPSTAGEDVDGNLFRLSDYRGKIVMLRFWGDWCGPCRAMYDYERDIVKKFQDRPFALIGVNSDPKERCRDAQVDNELVWRSFWDGGNTTGPISRLYQVADWPTIVVIDGEGVIRLRTTGLDRKYLTRVLERLLDETEATVTVGQK